MSLLASANSERSHISDKILTIFLKIFLHHAWKPFNMKLNHPGKAEKSIYQKRQGLDFSQNSKVDFALC